MEDFFDEKIEKEEKNIKKENCFERICKLQKLIKEEAELSKLCKPFHF